MRQIQLTPEARHSYKIGLDEVVGLETAMREALKPLSDLIQDKAYWTDSKHLVETAEYKSRDGFIPHSHNCGGLMISLVVPKCESYSWGFLEFGECDGCDETGTECTGDDEKFPDHGGECGSDSEGHLDAALRIFFKFEGLTDGVLSFYLNISGGNGDAPYFRSKHLADIFEAEFECKSVEGIKRAAARHIKAAIKAVQGA